MIGKLLTAFIALYLACKQNDNARFEAEDRKVELLDEYDFIVVGAGTTGSVVASRLAETGRMVLLLEAGESGREESTIKIPFYAPLMHGSKRDWNYSTTPQDRLNREYGNKPVYYPRGRVGGGTSAFNYHVYIRGSNHDYTRWVDEGAIGWGPDDLRHYFEKVEHASEKGMSKSLGRNGPLKLGKAYDNELTNIIHESAREIGIPVVNYMDGGSIKEGFSRITKTVVGGFRQYSFNSYLWPTWQNRKSNFHVAFGALAHKILTEEVDGTKRAIGVRFFHNGVIKEVRSRKEVVVSSGVFNSPQLLMLSGIGPRDHLEHMGIDVVTDLPGVGSNAEDHPDLPIYFYGENLPEDAVLTKDKALKTFLKYTKTGKGPLGGVIAFLSMGNIRSKLCGTPYSFCTEKYPVPDINYHVAGLGLNEKDFVDPNNDFEAEIADAKANRGGLLYNFAIWAFPSHTLSHGTVRLQSTDPNVNALYDGKYFHNEGDFKLMIEALRIIEQMEQSEEFKKYGLKMVMFPKHCSIEDKYAIPRSEEFYRCYLGYMTEAFYHASSTCKMGYSNNTMAVVDHRLRVHGIEGLRVADASVMPHITTANPQATCYAIGEKAVDMIKEDWEIE